VEIKPTTKKGKPVTERYGLDNTVKSNNKYA
jgi:hypothetical protein